MEGSVVDNLRSRSRSRSNTPLPRAGNPDRGTPTQNIDVESIVEEDAEEIFTSPPAHRTRNAVKQKTVSSDPANATSDYSSQDTEPSQNNDDQHIPEEIIQNIKNYSYEYETYSSSRTINANNINAPRGFISPGYDSASFATSLRNSYGYNRSHLSSSCSDKSNESFAESVLADSSKLSRNSTDHLPYQVYHQAIEYWNKYPKTDYTYSHLSRDRVELAPGQVAVPNMSRLSLGLFRKGATVYGGGLDEEESSALQNRTDEIRKRYLSENSSRNYTNSSYNRYEHFADSDYDETDLSHARSPVDQRWWITRVLMSVVTTLVTTVTSIKNRVTRGDASQRYPYYSSVNRYNTHSQEKSWITSTKESIKKRKWWILPFILLLPLLLFWRYDTPQIFHSYFNRTNVITIERPVKFELTDEMLKTIVLHVQQNLPEFNAQPQIIEKMIESPSNVDPVLLMHQQDLIEKLYVELDGLKAKLAANENIDEQISFLSSKQNSDMFVNIFGLEKNDGSPVTNADIKDWLKKETVSKADIELKLADALQSMSTNMNNAILNAVRSEVEQQQSIVNAGIKSAGIVATAPIIRSDTGCNCEEIVHKVVKEAIAIYDADKTGRVDYAMESAGGQVISTRCSESYQPRTAVYTILGIPFWYRSNTPRTAITPGTAPGECWAFQGFPGYLVIKLHTRIHVSGFTMEHTPAQLSPTGRIESAPKNFTVWGLQNEMDHEPVHFGTYEYRNDTSSIQYFPAINPVVNVPEGQQPGHEIVELRMESNHGHPHHTCLYRFRVHGDPAEDMSFYGSTPER